MFPSRKWVVERAQVLCEPLLPKLHPPLGLSGTDEVATIQATWRAILQPLNSRRSLQSTRHGKGHTEGEGPRGQGYAFLPCLPPVSGMHW